MGFINLLIYLFNDAIIILMDLMVLEIYLWETSSNLQILNYKSMHIMVFVIIFFIWQSNEV